MNRDPASAVEAKSQVKAAPHASEALDVVAALGSDAASGLTAAEAASRLSRYGANEITAEAPPSIVSVALQQLREPMNIMLVAVTVVSLLIGEVSTSSTPSPIAAIRRAGSRRLSSRPSPSRSSPRR